MPSSLQFPSLGYIAKPETNARSLLCNNMPYLGHVGDPHVMVFPAALLVASNGDVGCGAAHSVSAPRVSPLAAMSLLRDPIPSNPNRKAFTWQQLTSPPTTTTRHPNALQHARMMWAVQRCRAAVSALGSHSHPWCPAGTRRACPPARRRRGAACLVCARGPAAARRARASCAGSTRKPLCLEHGSISHNAGH